MRVYNLKRDVKEDNPEHIFDVKRGLCPIIDLRSEMPQIYDQGNLGSCTANALGAAFEYNQMENLIPYKCLTNKTATPFMPSRLFLYYNERAMAGDIPYDSGASLEDGVISLYKDGICPESIWKYDVCKFSTKPPTRAYWAAKKTRVGNYKKIQQTLSQIRASISDGYPISFGMQIYSSFESESVAKSGLVKLPSFTEKHLGGHAVLICGYNDYLKIFIVRNSWGDSWGDKGYFYISYEYVLSDLCRDFWVLVNVTV